MSKRDDIEQELARIWNERERLTPADVVEEAASIDSPLHPFFEWDDSEAARKFRLDQARTLIRSVKVKFTVTNAAGEVEDMKIRGWMAAHHAAPESGAPEGYMPESDVRQSPEIRAALLRQMQRDLQSLRRRYMHLTEFWRAMVEIVAESDQRAS